MNNFKVVMTRPAHENSVHYVECISFAEAARFAYLTRRRLGLDWKIVAVSLVEKDSGEKDD